MNTAMKKVLTSALAASLVLGSAAMAMAASGNRPVKTTKTTDRFADWQQVPDWSEEALTRMAVKGVMLGDDQGLLNPSNYITNAEAALMVVRFLGEIQEAEELNADEELVEVEDAEAIPDWAEDAIAWGVKNGVFVIGHGRFNPQHPLTRVEAARLLVKATKLEAEAESKQDATLPYRDAKQIPASYAGFVAVAYDHSWMVGDPNGMFHPNKNITRAEWATLLNRADISLDLPSEDGRQVKGTITAVTVGDAPSISVTTPVFPDGVTYPVADTATFFVSGEEATIADLQVGDTVLINLSEDRKVLAVTVVIKKESVPGSVESVTAATDTALAKISLKAADATEATSYEVQTGAVVKIGDLAGKLEDIKVGDKAVLTLERGKVVAIKVDVEVLEYEGEITAVALSQNNELPSVTVKTAVEEAMTFQVADFAQIIGADDANLTLADLKVGDTAKLRVQRNLIIRIRVEAPEATEPTDDEAQPELTEIEGTVVTLVTGADDAVGGVTIQKDGQTETYEVAAEAVITYDGQTITFADLHVGDSVKVTFGDGKVVAIEVTARAQTGSN